LGNAPGRSAEVNLPEKSEAPRSAGSRRKTSRNEATARLSGKKAFHPEGGILRLKLLKIDEKRFGAARCHDRELSQQTENLEIQKPLWPLRKAECKVLLSPQKPYPER
jgi:hypothetical protein